MYCDSAMALITTRNKKIQSEIRRYSKKHEDTVRNMKILSEMRRCSQKHVKTNAKCFASWVRLEPPEGPEGAEGAAEARGWGWWSALRWVIKEQES